MTAAIYARVSTDDQDCSMQLTELRGYVQRMGWEAVEYVEKASGKAGSKRPVLEKLMGDARLRKFDVVLVWKIDRFGRSMKEFIERVNQLDAVNVRFLSPNQSIDTDKQSPIGKFVMHIMMAFAELERSMITERVRSGVKEAQRRGKHCGRPKKFFDREIAARMRSRGMSWRKIERELGVPQATIRAALK